MKIIKLQITSLKPLSKIGTSRALLQVKAKTSGTKTIQKSTMKKHNLNLIGANSINIKMFISSRKI